MIPKTHTYEQNKSGRLDYFWLLDLQMVFIFFILLIYCLIFFCNECPFLLQYILKTDNYVKVKEEKNGH